MNSGIARGLASVSGQYDEKINSLYRNQQLDKQAEQLASARAELLAGDMDYEGGMNSFDAPFVKKFGQEMMKKKGEFYRNNPDAMWNPEKRAELKLMDREAKYHPDLLRGKASDMAIAEFTKDLQEVRKNPAKYDVEAYNDYKKQLETYLANGHQNGPEEAAKGKKAFSYTRPQELIDLAVELPKMGAAIHDREWIQGENGEWYSSTPQKYVDALKAAVYSQNGRSVQVTANQLGLKDPKHVDQWMDDLIRQGSKNEYHPGDMFAQQKLDIQKAHLGLARQKEARESAAAAPTTSTWDYIMNPANKSGRVDGPAMNKIYGDHEFKIRNANGNEIDLTGYGVWKSNERFVKGTIGPGKGKPSIGGYMDIPLNVAIDKKIVNPGWGPFSDEVAPGFGKNVTIETGTDSKGKEHKYVRIRQSMLIDPNDQGAKSRYEIETMPSKLVEQTTDVFAQPQNLRYDTKGNLFDENGNYVGKAQQ